MPYRQEDQDLAPKVTLCDCGHVERRDHQMRVIVGMGPIWVPGDVGWSYSGEREGFVCQKCYERLNQEESDAELLPE